MPKNDTDVDRGISTDTRPNGQERGRRTSAGQPDSELRQREPRDASENPDETDLIGADEDDEVRSADAEGFGQEAGEAEGNDRGQSRPGQGGGQQRQGERQQGVGDSGNRQGQREENDQRTPGNTDREGDNWPQPDTDRGDNRPSR